MRRLRARGVLPGPVAVRDELAGDPDLPQIAARDGLRLAALMESAPRAGHAEAYAAMVIDGAIHDLLRAAGSRLEQAAESGNLEETLRLARYARNEAEAARARWETLPPHLRRDLAGSASQRGDGAQVVGQAGAAGDDHERPGDGDRLARSDQTAGQFAEITPLGTQAAGLSTDDAARVDAAAERRPDGEQARAAGAQALRDLAAGPDQLAGVISWLRPGHFTCPEHGEVYRVMADLHTSGRPVDPVIVMWEATRRGVAMTPDEISTTLAGGTAALAPASARAVHEHGVLAQAAQAGRDIQAQASSPASSPARLFRVAGELLHAVEREHAAFQSASNSRVPETSRPGRYLTPIPEARREPHEEAARHGIEAVS
jgi:hypothetical protein